MTDLIDTGPDGAAVRLLLAHGAGAAMTSPFMDTFTALMSERGVAVTRFEFDYMAARRTGGKRRPPPRAETLMDAYRAVVSQVRSQMTANQTLVIGGKSMGGRVASLIADEMFSCRSIGGLVCLGYPFHPPAKPDQLRTEHLKGITCPTLIVQGERDPFGSRAEVAALMDRGAISHAIELHWAGDGDHDLGPRGGKGFTRKGNLAAAADAVASFVASDNADT